MRPCARAAGPPECEVPEPQGEGHHVGEQDDSADDEQLPGVGEARLVEDAEHEAYRGDERDDRVMIAIITPVRGAPPARLAAIRPGSPIVRMSSRTTRNAGKPMRVHCASRNRRGRTCRDPRRPAPLGPWADAVRPVVPRSRATSRSDRTRRQRGSGGAADSARRASTRRPTAAIASRIGGTTTPSRAILARTLAGCGRCPPCPMAQIRYCTLNACPEVVQGVRLAVAGQSRTTPTSRMVTSEAKKPPTFTMPVAVPTGWAG